MYPFQLGWHIKTRQLCRIPIGYIPLGTVKILKYKEVYMTHISHIWTIPYALPDGELKSYYWSIYRWIDLERQK